MTLDTATSFLHSAIPAGTGIWADIGAGSGIFSRTLDRLLSPGSTIYAIDKTVGPLHRLRLENSELIVQAQDFTRNFSLPPLNGIIMANALHYAKDQVAVLKRLSGMLQPGGRLVLIEYETQASSPWVPYPVPFRRWWELAMDVGLSAPEVLAQLPSAYGHNHIYLAPADKLV